MTVLSCSLTKQGKWPNLEHFVSKHLFLQLKPEFEILNKLPMERRIVSLYQRFVHIKHFLQNSAVELYNQLQSRERKKLSPTGEYATRGFARTRQNNRHNRPQPTVIHSQAPVNASTNHILPMNAPVITAVNSSTPIHNHIRRLIDRKQLQTDTGAQLATTTFN